MKLRRRFQQGVSLIEALVALAVMAFGMMGVAGLQASLRVNADVARQRSEAVRIAQEAIENARAFSVVQTPAPAGKTAYDGLLLSLPATAVTGAMYASANTAYTMTQTLVVNAPQNMKTVTVDVTWVDRSNTPQTIRLSANIHRMAPELAAALSVPGSGGAVQLPGGRHPNVPPGAVNQGDGTSRLPTPGGDPGSYWVFNNTTGLITRICLLLVCADVEATFIGGYINYSTGSTQPTPAQAESPLSAAAPTPSVLISLTYPSVPAFTPECFVGLDSPTAYAYFCVVPISTSAPNVWSGRTLLDLGTALASSLTDADASKYRICRYTPYRDHRVVGGMLPMTNAEHPLDYLDVSTSIIDQNFLVIRAGDGGTAFVCPADNGSPAPLNTNTWHHQPEI